MKRLFFVFMCVFLSIGFLFLAESRADTTSTILPVADGENDSANWSSNSSGACDSANCFVEVDDTSGGECMNSDGDSTYINASTQGANQTFNIDTSSITDNSTITQIDVIACHKRGSAPPNEFQIRYCVDGSCTNSGTSIRASGNYDEETQSFSGLNISKTSNSDVEVGVTISGANNRDVRISKLSAVITYTPPQCNDGVDNDNDGKVDYPADDGCDSASDINEASSTSNGAGGNGGGSQGGGGVPPSKVIFSGKAYPGASIEVLRRGSVGRSYRNIPVTQESIDAEGNFFVSYTGLLGGDYVFALRAIDRDGRRTGVLSFNVNLASRASLEARDLILPPTFDFADRTIGQKDIVDISGYATPGSTVELQIGEDAIATTTSSQNGSYSFAVEADMFSIGAHNARVRQTLSDDRVSSFSIIKTFRIATLSNPRADLNDDGRVNINDWSIFLFRWVSGGEIEQEENDINDDSKVDIFDFSSLLHALLF